MKLEIVQFLLVRINILFYTKDFIYKSRLSGERNMIVSLLEPRTKKQETGDRKQETRNKRQETGNKKQETRKKRQETRNRK